MGALDSAAPPGAFPFCSAHPDSYGLGLRALKTARCRPLSGTAVWKHSHRSHSPVVPSKSEFNRAAIQPRSRSEMISSKETVFAAGEKSN
jgi:hypothetical protein